MHCCQFYLLSFSVWTDLSFPWNISFWHSPCHHCKQVGVMRDQWREQASSPSHGQNWGFLLTSSRAYAKAYPVLMDDVYSSVAFQASVHFGLPSDFGKLFNDDFVNIIEVETFACAFLLKLAFSLYHWPRVLFVAKQRCTHISSNAL